MIADMKGALLCLSLLVLSLYGCRKDGETDLRTVRISTSSESDMKTRTQIGDDIEGELFMEWSVSDKIGVFGASTINAVMANTEDIPSYQTVFKGNIDKHDIPQYAYYPYDETVTDISSVPVSIPSKQVYADVTSVALYDVKASVGIEGISENQYVMYMRQMASLLRFDVDIDGLEELSPDEKLQSVTLESTGDRMTGQYTYSLSDLDAGFVSVSASAGSNSLELSFYHTPDLSDFIRGYAVVVPGKHEGKELTLTILTDKHRISFTTQALTDFEAGKFSSFPLTQSVLQNNNCEVTDL